MPEPINGIESVERKPFIYRYRDLQPVANPKAVTAPQAVSESAQPRGTSRQHHEGNNPDSNQAHHNAGRTTPAQQTTGNEGVRPGECLSCKTRRYVDGSSDPSVSFKTPTHVPPELSAAAVGAHEAQHVHHEQINAERDGRAIVSQTVQIHTAICPECGRVYVSGGETTTVSKPKEDNAPRNVDLRV